MDLVGALMNVTGVTQATRHIQIDTAMPDAFVVERFHGREAVNESFRFEIDVLSNADFLDLTPLLGSAARLRLATANGERCWNGYVTHAAYADSDGEITRYRITMESWLALLQLRRNCLYFVELDTASLCERVFGDYLEARRRYDLHEPLRTFALRGQYRETDLDFVRRQLAEAGLSFRIEHAQDAGKTPSGDHTLVVFDRRASFDNGTTISFNRQDVGDADGVMTQFAERRQLVPDSVVATSWKSSELLALAGRARQSADDGAPMLPAREIYEGQRAERFETSDEAQRYADQRLDALQLDRRIYHGAGSSRTLETGKVHTLTGYLDAAVRFVPLSIEHEAVNNLGAQIAQVFASGDLDHGLYRNRFVAVPEGVAIVPPYRDRPVVHGVQTAIVVGEPGNAVSSTRDHQVRIQFAWMRGVAPLAGGLTDTASRSNPAGHAPGDHRSGVLVRVAEQAAGPNFGHAFTPRVGTEVVVGFESGNIDLPVVLGQVYGGRVQPPFAAGEGSDANHAGTLTGLQTRTLDGQSGSRWVMDDAAGQVRHELGNSTASSTLAQGYLIAQQGATRGAYRGEGFELATQGWGVVRAGEGVLVSSTARRQAVSTQMDAAERVEQLKAAVSTAGELDTAAVGAQAGGLSANAAQSDFLKSIDPAQDGKHTGSVNGQSATQPDGAAVARFALPAVLMESPNHIALTTPNSAVAYAAQHVHVSAQGDAHVGAAATLAAVAGDRVSLYSVAGGVKAIASEGPVSVEAHAATMEILGDQTVSVTSTAERVDVLAKEAIVLQQGQNRITIKGADIIVETPGQFMVKAGGHPFPGPRTASVKLPAMPLMPQGEPCEFMAQSLANVASATGAAAPGGATVATAVASQAAGSASAAAVASAVGLSTTGALAAPLASPLAARAAAMADAPAPPAMAAQANTGSGATPGAPAAPATETRHAPSGSAAGGPCSAHLPSMLDLDHVVGMGCVDYYETDLQGNAVLDKNHHRKLWQYASLSGKYDIAYSPGDSTLTASVRIKVTLKDQHVIRDGAVVMDKKTGKPFSVPFSTRGAKQGVTLKIVDRQGDLADSAGLKKRIESGLNLHGYCLKPKNCPRGNSCTCTVKIKTEVDFVKDGRFHAAINLFPAEVRADSENWGERRVQWNEDEQAYEPLRFQNTPIHESGHLFGWPDEYFDGGGAVYGKYINAQKLVDVKMPQLIDNWQRTTDDNIMGGGLFKETPEIARYYMYGFRDWFEKRTLVEWEVVK
ncbi:type VI secretion system Vgr family protein [Paraburkholderia bannensis]|uniref:type VI secretion system Vgr family protein n=1 Tax=Paraburkholderia bannensis TaxID=765414 RepID=UPI002ABE6E71|nr:type VI secretion system Vgr family protein [Paraburkholderia bannensis]